MSLYDDEDIEAAAPTDVTAGWSRGVQILQSQKQLKKASAKILPTSQMAKPVGASPAAAAAAGGGATPSFSPLSVVSKLRGVQAGGGGPLSVMAERSVGGGGLTPSSLQSDKKKKSVSGYTY